MTPVHDSKPLTPLSRARVLVFAALLSAILVAGCGGGGSGSPTTAASNAGHATTSGSTTTTGGGTSSARQTASDNGPPGALAYSECMRANGVTNFPDPQPGGGLLFHASPAEIASPAFKAAQAKCVKLMPGGGPPGPGTHTHPTAQTLARFRRIADCMRQHGVPDFPDPMTSVPANPFGSGGTGIISDIEDVIFVFPSTINQQAPAFTQAAAACGFPLHNH